VFWKNQKIYGLFQNLVIALFTQPVYLYYTPTGYRCKIGIVANLKSWEEIMQEVSNHNLELTNRISPIVEKLFKSNSLYVVKLKKWEMVEMLVNLFSEFTPEEMAGIKEEDLIQRIDSILILNAVSGTLSDLTSEQLQMFDESVEGR
jgi:hypothetical protein